MQIHLISVGQNMPRWVTDAFDEYARRMPHRCALKLREIPAIARKPRADLARIARDEGEQILAAVPKHAKIIALTREGKMLGTPAVASELQTWIDDGDDVALLVGGPEGLDDAVIRAAHWEWSLSKLTFAHPLVRVILAEQLYRAWSVIEGKPYHRGASL